MTWKVYQCSIEYGKFKVRQIIGSFEEYSAAICFADDEDNRQHGYGEDPAYTYELETS